MSDKFPAQIWIGSKVTKAQLKGLVSALHEDGASDDYGNPAIAEDCTNWDGLALYLDDESLLTLKDDQAHNGEFELTEQFCVNEGITFDRNSDHYMEYDAENAYFRPGTMRVPMVLFADSRGAEIVRGKTVREAMVLLGKFVDSVESKNRYHGWVDDAIRLLCDACPELPPKLEPFTISA